MTPDNRIVETLLKKTPTEIQSVASEVLETNRIPDPYIFLVNRYGRLTLRDGTIVETNIDTTNQLGQIEMRAFEQIQTWAADRNRKDRALWFSSPYPGIYPNSKVIISEKLENEFGILNRAVVLDINEKRLIELANNNQTNTKFTNSIQLRSTPLFLNHQEFLHWFKELEKITDQTEYMKSGQDLIIKSNIVVQVEDIQSSIEVYSSSDSKFNQIMQRAKENKMYGEYSPSCPVVLKTAFSEMFNNSLIIGDGKYVKNCGNCGRMIEKKIKKGYKCTCGGEYKGC